MKKNPRSFFIMLFLGILLIAGRTWKQDPHPISWDVAGYYLYLPNIFIYHDPGMKDFQRMDSLRVQYETSSSFYQVHISPIGKPVIKYTMGNSIFYAPFFFTGHLIAKITGAPANGYSWPYQRSLMWGTLIYALLALALARQVLLHFFNDQTTAFTLGGIILGTNAFLMLSMDNLQVHYHLFFAYTLLLWLTIRFHLRPSVKTALGLGLAAGLIILVRPTDIISWTLPLLWGVQRPADLLTKIRTLGKYIPVFIFIAFLVFLPQLVYWKTYGGSWLYNSYNNPGEGLDLTRPHLLPFLTSYRKGWLLYTPMVFFMLAGLVISFKKNRGLFYPVLIFFMLNLWIVSSWTCWWYAGSFSSRAMIQSYAVLMLPLGHSVQYIWSKKGFFIYMLRWVFLLLICFNLFQTWQYIEGILRPDGMTRAYYRKVFGTVHPTSEYDHLLLKDKYLGTDTLPHPQDFNITLEFLMDFDRRIDTQPHVITETLASGREEQVLVMDTSYRFCTLLERPYHLVTDKYYAYVRVKGFISNPGGYGENPVELVRTMQHRQKNYAYAATVIHPEPADTSGAWQPFTYDYIFPDVRNSQDPVKIYFWYRGHSTVSFKHVYVQVLEARAFPELE